MQSLKDFSEMISNFLKNNDGENDEKLYDKYCNFLLKKATIEKAEKVVEMFSDDFPQNKNPKALLTAILIEKFPFFLLPSFSGSEKIDDGLDKNCYKKAKKFVEFAKKFQEKNDEHQRFLRLAEKYLLVFAEWRKQDFILITEMLLRNYVNISVFCDQVGQNKNKNNDIFIDQVWKMKTWLKQQIIMLKGEKYFESVENKIKENRLNIVGIDLNNARNRPKTILDNSEEIKIASENYWSDFANQIRAQDYSLIMPLVNEIVFRVKELAKLSETNKARFEELINRIDLSFIRQLIYYSSLDADSFLSLFKVLWKAVFMVQRPIDDNKWKEWKMDVETRLKNGDPLEEIIPPVFNKILCQLDIVEDLTRSVLKNV